MNKEDVYWPCSLLFFYHPNPPTPSFSLPPNPISSYGVFDVSFLRPLSKTACLSSTCFYPISLYFIYRYHYGILISKVLEMNKRNELEKPRAIEKP